MIVGLGVKNLFDTAVKTVLHPPEKKKKKTGLLTSLWSNTLGGLFKKLVH